MKNFIIIFFSVLVIGCESITFIESEPNQEACKNIGMIQFTIRPRNDNEIHRVLASAHPEMGYFTKNQPFQYLSYNHFTHENTA